MDEAIRRIDWVYSAQTNQELTERYNQWAEHYDSDLVDVLGRTLDEDPAVTLLVQYLPKTARILDAGAGTGLIGQLLDQLGYHHLVAMDLSTGMLERAEQKGVYQAYHQMVLGERLDFSAHEFDAIIACGVFTYGHAPASSFDELLRITKPGGYLTFTMRPEYYQESEFKEKFSTLEENNQWHLVEAGRPYQALPETEPEMYLQAWIYQVN